MFWANSKLRKIVDCDIQNAYFWGFEKDSASYIDPTSNLVYTSSTAQGGGGSFKNWRPIGGVGCYESGMAERSHWWTERCLRSPLFLSFSLCFSIFLWWSTYLPTDLSVYLSIYLFVCLSPYLSIYLSFYLSI